MVLTIAKKQKLTAKTLPYERALECYWLTPEEAQGLKVYRLEEHADDGYQRNLEIDRVQKIVKDLLDHRSMPYAPIYCALIDGELWIIDGQHRANGHIEAQKRIAIFVWDMDTEQATETFNRDNGCQVRPPRAHMAWVSNSEKTDFIRSICEEFPIHKKQVIVMMDKLCGKIGSFDRDAKFTKKQEKAAYDILTILIKKSSNKELWSEKDRTTGARSIAGKKSPLSPSDAYSSKITLAAIARDVHDRIEKGLPYTDRILAIADADWNNKSGSSLRMMATYTGTAGAKQMLDFMKSKILADL